MCFNQYAEVKFGQILFQEVVGLIFAISLALEILLINFNNKIEPIFRRFLRVLGFQIYLYKVFGVLNISNLIFKLLIYTIAKITKFKTSLYTLKFIIKISI